MALMINQDVDNVVKEFTGPEADKKAKDAADKLQKEQEDEKRKNMGFGEFVSGIFSRHWYVTAALGVIIISFSVFLLFG